MIFFVYFYAYFTTNVDSPGSIGLHGEVSPGGGPTAAHEVGHEHHHHQPAQGTAHGDRDRVRYVTAAALTSGTE